MTTATPVESPPEPGEVSDRRSREELKAELEAEILELYEGDVIDLLFTEFVTP